MYHKTKKSVFMHLKDYAEKQNNNFFSIFSFFLYPKKAICLEPVTPLDDGFSIPCAESMEKHRFSFPAAISLMRKAISVLGYSYAFEMEDLAVRSFIAG